MNADQLYLFRTAFKHIIKQGGPSANENGVCFYEGPNGEGCAARPFITGYNPGMEARPFSTIAFQYPDCVDPIAAKNAEFVEALQSAHDTAAETNNFDKFYRDNMRMILKAHGWSWGDVNEEIEEYRILD